VKAGKGTLTSTGSHESEQVFAGRDPPFGVDVLQAGGVVGARRLVKFAVDFVANLAGEAEKGEGCVC